MSFRKLLVAALLTGASGLAAAQGLDINLGNKSAAFRYNAFVGGSTFGRTELNFGFLYNSDKNRYGDVGLLVVDKAGSKAPGLEVGIGPKLMFLWDDERDSKGAAIAIGGRLNYKPQKKLKRMRTGIEGYYAPSITSFIDSKYAYYLEARIGYEVLPTAIAYLGYRRIYGAYNKDRGSGTLDNTGMLGIQFSF